MEGTVGNLTEDEIRKIQLRKVKLEAKLRKLISAHGLVVASYELNPMLEEKYQILKQNMYNDIATCEVMLEPITSPVSDTSSKIEKVETPYELQTIPIMDPTEKEFRERLGSMERDEEVPSYIKPEMLGKREVYYLTLKRRRIISNVELLNHMYGAVQAIGNLDINIIDRYQAVKRKATKTIQKCNELLNATGKGIDNGSELSSESPWEIIPNKTPRRDNTLNQERLILPFENKEKSLIAPRGGFGMRPDSGERGQEREELLRTVKEITKGKGEIVSRQDVKGTMIYPKMGWDRLELPDNHYEFREKDLSWDYSDANIPYEGSYLTANSEMSRNITTGTREKPKGSKQRLKIGSTQTPYGNKTSVSVDKETQITPQKANTPLRETMTKKTEGTVIRSVKVGSKKKRKRKLVEYDKARIYPPELGMTEEEMLRRGPMCKDCHKGHFGQVCPCNKCGWIHPHRGCLDRPFTPKKIPTITKVPPENNQNKEIKLTVPIKGEHWCWLCKSHGPEKICPRKDEIDTEYGRQRLKELLQEMMKPQEKLGEEWNNNDVTSKVSQEAWLLETPSYSTGKGELIGPKIVQPP